jgi:hypothetical protein
MSFFLNLTAFFKKIGNLLVYVKRKMNCYSNEERIFMVKIKIVFAKSYQNEVTYTVICGGK